MYNSIIVTLNSNKIDITPYIIFKVKKVIITFSL